MNKEELLKQLEELRSHLPKGELDGMRISTDNAIAELENKLADNSNYISNKANFFNSGRRNNLEKAINSSQVKMVESQNNVTAIQKNIEITQKDLDSIPDVVKDLENQLTTAGRDLRANINPTPEQDAVISSRLKTLRDQIAEYRSHEATLKANMLEYQRDLELNQNQVSEYGKREQRYQTLLTSFNERLQNEDANTNLGLKLKDEANLDALKNTKESLEGKFEYSMLDLGDELDDLMTNLSNDTMTPEQVITSLETYKNSNIDYQTFVNNDEARMNELSDIDNSRSAMSMEISDLQTKLGNDNNYLVSSFVTELNEERISKAEQNMNDAQISLNECDESVATYTNDIARANNEIAFSESCINSMREEIVEWNIQIKRLDKDNDKDLITKINRKISINEAQISSEQKNISYLLNEQVTIKNQLDGAQKRKSIQLDKITRYGNLIDNMQAKNENVIDEYAKRLDEKRLADLISGAAALDSRKAFLDYDFEASLENVLSSNMEDQTIEAPIHEPIKEDVIDEVVVPENKNTIEGIMDNVKEDAIVEDQDADDIIPSIDKGLDDNISDIMDEEKQLPATIGVAAFEKPGSKLLENIRKKEPLEAIKKALKAMKDDFKKEWPRYVLVAATAFAIAHFIPVSNNSNVPEDTNTYNIEDSVINDAISNEGNNILDDSEDDLVPDTSIDDENKNTEDKKSNNTNSNTNQKDNNTKSNSSSKDDTSSKVKDKGGQKISEKTEVIKDDVNKSPYDDLKDSTVHENEPDTSIQPGTTFTGGEQETIVNSDGSETQIDNSTNNGNSTSTPGTGSGDSNNSTGSTTDTGNGSTTEEIIYDDVISPTTDGGNSVVTPTTPESSDTSYNVQVNQGETLTTETENGTVSVDGSGNVSGDTSQVDVQQNEDGVSVTIGGQIGEPVDEIVDENSVSTKKESKVVMPVEPAPVTETEGKSDDVNMTVNGVNVTISDASEFFENVPSTEDVNSMGGR